MQDSKRKCRYCGAIGYWYAARKTTYYAFSALPAQWRYFEGCDWCCTRQEITEAQYTNRLG